MALAVRAYPQENTGVKRPVDLCFQRQLEIAERLGGRQETSFSGRILDADDRTVFNGPFACRLCFTGKSIMTLPAGQVGAVEQ